MIATSAGSALPATAREFTLTSYDRTMVLARGIGRRLDRGLTILLYGDMGSGKTAFSQGLARGLDVPADYAVTSPTYTLVNEYPGRLPFYHVDLYRLPEPVDPDDIGLDDLFDGNGVAAVEWADRLHPDDRPARRLDIHFTVTGETSRRVRIIAYGLDPADLIKDIDV